MTPRRIGAWLAAVLLLMLAAPAYSAAVGPSVPRAPAGAGGGDANARGFEQLNACLASGERVDALYVVDVSGSLAGNDPDGRRFEALGTSVAQLGVLAAGAEGLEVEAAVSTFGDSFSPPRSVQDWTPVDTRSAADVAATFRARAEQAWRDAGTSQGTNYEAALDGAQSVLAARGARSSACQVVFWFTDGLFALGDTYDQAATNAASRRMCRPGGLVDQMREQQTSIIALALTGPDVDAQLDQPQYADRRGELQAMAVGASRATTCGATPVLETSRSGIYLTVDDPVGLGGLFSGVAAQAAGCTPEKLRAETPVRFRVQPGVNRFQVDTSTDGGGGAVTVTAPSGISASASSGSRRLGDAKVRVLRTGSLATVTVILGSTEAAGVWSVDAGSEGRAASVTLYRCSDLRLEIVEPDEQLAGGDLGVVEAVAVDSTGAPADLTSYRGPAATDPVSVTVATNPESQASVTVTEAGEGRLRIELTPPDDTTAVEVRLALTPRLADAPEIEFGQVTAARRLPVTPPGSFPTVTPAELDLGTSVGLDPATGVLEVAGSDQGSARICVDEATAIEVPDESGTNQIAASAECLDLAAGESAEVEVSVTPETSVDGEGTATLPVRLVNADGEEIQQEVALRWELERRIDQGARLWLVAAAILFSLLLLALVLALINKFLARFGVGDVRFATVPVEVDRDGQVRLLERVGEERPDYVHIGKSERRSLADPRSGIALRAKAPLTLGDPEFTARAPAGARLVPPDGDVRDDAIFVPVSAGLGAGWLLQVSDSDLVAEADDRPTPARLTVYGRGDIESLQRMSARCIASVSENGWPQVRSDLAELARASVLPSGDTARTDAMLTAQPDGAVDDEDPFGGDSFAQSNAPRPADPRPAPRGRWLGRSSRRARDEPDSAAADRSSSEDEDPFA